MFRLLQTKLTRGVRSGYIVFERYETISPVKVAFTESKLALPKVTFIAMQVLTILLGMWKLNAMGLLPTSHSDWLAFLDPKTPIEYAA